MIKLPLATEFNPWGGGGDPKTRNSWSNVVLHYLQFSPLLNPRLLLSICFALQAAFRTDLSVLLDHIGAGKESLSFMKRRIRRLAQQWATAANRLDAKLGQRWRDQKKVRNGAQIALHRRHIEACLCENSGTGELNVASFSL